MFNSYSVERLCAICGAGFVPDKHHPHAKTCSRPCNRKLEYRTHKKSYLIRAIAYRRANPQKYREYTKATHRRNPGLYRTLWRNREHVRRARMNKQPYEKIPHEWWIARISLQDGRCWWCGERKEKLEMDHVFPVKLGGRHARENIVAACGLCNKKKHAKVWPLSQGGQWIVQS
jgi:5-methylcytosine-specific restriction endonuclease McrA